MNESILVNLPHSLFILVCSFLSLHDKCRGLPVLSRALHTAIDPSTCCRGEVSLAISTKGRPSWPCGIGACWSMLGPLPYIKYASEVNIKLSEVHQIIDFDQNIISQAMIDAIDNPFLTSLNIDDCWFKNSYGLLPITRRLLDRTPSELRNLTSLTIACKETISPYELSLRRRASADVLSVRHIDWSGLSNCSSLTKCDMNIDQKQLGNLLDSLPPTLTSLKLRYTEQSMRGQSDQVLADKLQDPSFLPRLMRLDSDRHEIMFDGLSTIMNETGCVRPIEQLKMLMRPGLSFTCFTSVHTWVVDLKRMVNELRHLSVDVMPHLRCLNVLFDYLPDAAVDEQDVDRSTSLDIVPLIEFISNRPIEVITIELSSATANDRVAYPGISQQVARALFQMSSLKSLSLIEVNLPFISYLFDDFDMDDLMLPSLTSLSLYGKICSGATARSLFQVMPMLTSLSIEHSQNSWISTLPLLARSCRKIEKIWLESVLHPCTLADLQTAFTEYPLDQTRFQYLASFRVVGEVLSDATLHYVISQLSVAPRLSIFTCAHSGSVPTAFRLYMQSKLPYLTMMSEHESTLLNRLHHSASGTRPSFFRGFHPSVKSYDSPRIFRTMTDDPPSDGRTELFRELFIVLNGDERNLLQRWNAGNYADRGTSRIVRHDMQIQ